MEAQSRKASLDNLLKQNAHVRINGRVASSRTINARIETLHTCFKHLDELGYRLQDAKNLNNKHIGALIKYWSEVKQLAPKTIEGYLSTLRIFSIWIGKKGMVKGKYEYVDADKRELLKVNTAALSSKSLTGNNVDIDQLFKRTDEYDTRLGIMLRMELAFGLRREEVIKCKPHHQDFGVLLAVFSGQGKGGRERDIYTMSSSQRETIEKAKKFVGKNESLGWTSTKRGKTPTLKQNLKRYSNALFALGITKEELGVTGHSLRAQFAENNALMHGIIPPSIGGTKGQMPKDEMKLRLTRLSEAMGHHREKVMTAYYCSFGKKATLDRADRCMRTIDQATAILNSRDLPHVNDLYKDDCASIRNYLDILEVDITLKQIHHLWSMYSLRNGTIWVKPEHEIANCIESSALEIIRQAEKYNGQQAA